MVKVVIKNRTIHIVGSVLELDHINRLTFGINFDKRIRRENPHTKIKERVTIKATFLEMFPLNFLADIKDEYEDFRDLVDDLAELAIKINGGKFREANISTKLLKRDNLINVRMIDERKSLLLIKIVSRIKGLKFKIIDDLTVDIWSDVEVINLKRAYGGKFNYRLRNLINVSKFGSELVRAALNT